MNKALEWIKANVLTVIFLTLAVAAVVAMPLVAGSLNASVRETVEKRSGRLRELDKLQKTSVTLAGESHTVLVNRDLLDRFKVVTDAQRMDAQRVLETAETHNRKGRSTLLGDRLFPAPAPNDRDVLPERFHVALMEAYDALLAEINAGSPPTLVSMTEDLQRRRSQFLTQMLAKDLDDPLDAEEREQLEQVLSEARMSRYAQAAEGLGLYVDRDGLYLPAWDYTRQPTMSELFDWQWQFWIVEDVLRALAEANRSAGTIPNAPVKRIRELVVFGDPVAARGSSSPGGGFGAGAGPGPGAGPGRRGGGSSGGGTAAGPAAAPIDPKREAPLDYAYSFTGRHTNPLYDVRLARATLVVEAVRVPEVLDALARHNFMTIVDLTMQPADPYDAIQGGYFYGAGPLTALTITFETIWLRAWTAPLMPDEVKQARGIPIAARARRADPEGGRRTRGAEGRGRGGAVPGGGDEPAEATP